MKKLLLTAAVFGISLFSAQQLSQEQYQILKYDAAERFSELASPKDFNRCFDVKENQYTLLALAIKMNSTKIFQKLIDEKADLEKVCDGKTPLMFAAKYGNAEMAKKLLQYGAKKSATTEKGYTALDYAKKYEKIEMIKLLE